MNFTEVVAIDGFRMWIPIAFIISVFLYIALGYLMINCLPDVFALIVGFLIIFAEMTAFGFILDCSDLFENPTIYIIVRELSPMVINLTATGAVLMIAERRWWSDIRRQSRRRGYQDI